MENELKTKGIKKELIDSYLWSNLYIEKKPIILFINELERDIISKTIQICNGSIKNAAELLNINYTTLFEKVKKYNISIIKKKYLYELLD